MSVSFDNASTLQATTSHQCSRDADGDGEGGRNGYPSDSMKATLTKKYYVAESEDHGQTRPEEFDSEEAPCPTSDEDDNDEEEADSTDSDGAGATVSLHICIVLYRIVSCVRCASVTMLYRSASHYRRAALAVTVYSVPCQKGA